MQKAPLSDHSTAGDRGMHSGEITWSQHVLCFTTDSRHLHSCATAFLGKNGSVHNTMKLSSWGRELVFTLLGPLRFVVLNPSCVPQRNHRRILMLGVLMAQVQIGLGQGSDRSLGGFYLGGLPKQWWPPVPLPG